MNNGNAMVAASVAAALLGAASAAHGDLAPRDDIGHTLMARGE